MSKTLQSHSGAITAFHSWLAATGVSRVTGWRWIKRGWIHPINIAGRLYLTSEEIKNFRDRARNGQFAKAPTGAAASNPEGRSK